TVDTKRFGVSMRSMGGGVQSQLQAMSVASELFSKVFLPLEMTRRITSTIKAVNDLKLKVDALSLSLITAGSNFASIGVLDAQQKLGGITDLEAEIRRMRSKAAAEINKITRAYPRTSLSSRRAHPRCRNPWNIVVDFS